MTPQEPPSSPPSLFWNACARPEEVTPTVIPVPRHLLHLKKLRTIEEVELAVRSRYSGFIPILVQTLVHRDRAVSRAAMEGLREFGDHAFHSVRIAAMEGRGALREQAVLCLGQLGDSRAISVLLEVMQREHRERVRGNFFVTISVGCMNFLKVLFLLGIEAICGFITYGTALGVTTGAWKDFDRPRDHWNRDTSLRRYAAKALADLGDIRAIPALVEMLNPEHPDISGIALNALRQLLPLVSGLRMEQAGSLPPDLVPALAKLMQPFNLELTRHALSALYAIGDGRALPAVERLITSASAFRDLDDIAQTARMLVPILQERATQDEYRRTLLRGTTAPAATSGELLRPAHGHATPSTPPQELLRPGNLENH